MAKIYLKRVKTKRELCMDFDNNIECYLRKFFPRKCIIDKCRGGYICIQVPAPEGSCQHP